VLNAARPRSRFIRAGACAIVRWARHQTAGCSYNNSGFADGIDYDTFMNDFESGC
jgi:hypothetical protein